MAPPPSATPILDSLLGDSQFTVSKDEIRRVLIKLATEAVKRGWHPHMEAKPILKPPTVFPTSSLRSTLPPLPSVTLSRKRVHFEDGKANEQSQKRTKYAHVTKQPEVIQAPPVSPSLVPPLPAPLPPTNLIPPTLDELAFFDRVRKHLANKSQYTEFLKLVNLYTQDLCSPQWLAFRVQSFIGNNPDLYNYFKTFIGAEPEDEIIDNQPAQPTGRVALSNCRGLGPSYRLLPKSETNKPCAGRDDLCRSVLNDEWASHPTWASEDSGFVAHRKNQYEEGLHRIEEERHDYDSNLGALERTIQLLEPIAQSLAAASPDQREHFQLSPSLGGQSETIYKRPIFKIYGREKGREVLHLLFVQPYNVIPTLLARLKSKREEWLAAQREWNKVWRMQTNTMFWRSLDHQGAGARNADKKQFSTKTLQADFIAKELEHKKMRENLQHNVPEYTYEYSFEDTSVLYDALTLLFIHIDNRAELTESPRLPNFIKEFATLFFGLDLTNLRSSFTDGQSPADYGDEDSVMAEDGLSPRQKPNGKRNESLLRGVLERGRVGRTIRRDDDSAASDSRATTPEPTSIADEEVTGAPESPPASETLNDRPVLSGDKWLDHPVDKNILNGQTLPVQEPMQRNWYNMYINWQFFFFIRLLFTLYERLQRLKNDEENVRKLIDRALMEKDADDLGWRDRLPTSFFKVARDSNYYNQMLVKFEELILDPTTERSLEVEETLRRHYLYTGWQLYNCDKLVSSIVKQAVNIISGDSKDNSWAIYQAWKKDRQREETTHMDEISYRRQVEKFAKDTDILKVSYVGPPGFPISTERSLTAVQNTETKVAGIKKLRKVDPTFEERPKTRQTRWHLYLGSFTSVEPTEDVDLSRLHFPFLRHSLKLDESLIDQGAWGPFASEEKLVVRVDPKTYGLQPDPESYDYIVRKKQPKIDYDQEMEATIYEDESRREEVALEKFVMNNKWMKGLSKDEVDTTNTDYQSKAKFDYGEVAAVADRDDAGKIRVGKDQRAEEPELEDVAEKERSPKDKIKKTNLKKQVKQPTFDFDGLPGWSEGDSVPIASVDEEDEMEE